MDTRIGAVSRRCDVRNSGGAAGGIAAKKITGLRLNHFGIYVKDLDESTSFYTNKMGFREAFRFKDTAGKPIVYLQMSRDTFLELTPADAEHASGFSHPASGRTTWNRPWRR